LLLLAFCAFFFLWKLASFGLVGADEPRYAQVAREMLARHDWVTPTLGEVPWLEKPPLYYWQAIIAYRLFGVSDWAARLPSVLDASILVFTVYCFLRRFHREAALDGALLLASCAGIVGYARAASTDMPLAASFSIAMIAWFVWLETESRIHLATFYGFLALATLAKGPVALFFAGVIILLFAGVPPRRSWKIAWTTVRLPEILLFCAIALPWYVLVQLRNPQFFRVFILQHNLARFGTNVFHHPEPFWYYVPVTLIGWVPWSVFLIAALVWAIRKFTEASDLLNPFMLLWIATVVIFFSISQSKLPGYVLPAIPPGVILLANYGREESAAKINPALIVLHALLAAVLIFAAFISASVIFQHRINSSSFALMPAILAIVVSALAAVVLFKSASIGLRASTIVPVVALAFALRLGAPAIDQRLSARPISEELSQVAPKPLPLAVVLVPREMEFGLEFYRNQPIPRYELGQAPAGEHLVLAMQGFRNAFAKNVPGRRIVYLGSFPQQKVEFFYVGP
jgi:4-amino-4-deoxy-L-arabinose transferase-like glycosyltransferase